MRYKIQVTVMSLYASLALMACGQNNAISAPQETLSPPVNAAVPAPAEVKSTSTKIVFLGDSLTAGFGLPQDQAWPEQVQERLSTAGYKTTVINAGVSGDTSANGLARYDWSVGSLKADVLVIALGANDFLQGMSPNVTRQNLTAIIERAQSDSMEIILAGVAAPQTRTQGPAQNAYAKIYPDLAKHYGLSLFPSILEGVRQKPELLQRDGLHPTQAGVEVMANRFAPHLIQVLKGLEPK